MRSRIAFAMFVSACATAEATWFPAHERPVVTYAGPMPRGVLAAAERTQVDMTDPHDVVIDAVHADLLGLGHAQTAYVVAAEFMTKLASVEVCGLQTWKTVEYARDGTRLTMRAAVREQHACEGR